MPAKSKKQQMAARAALAAKRGERKIVAQRRLEKHGEIDEHERTQENGRHEAQKFAEKEELNALRGGFTFR